MKRKTVLDDIVLFLAHMDERVNNVQIHFPTFLRVHEDLSLLGRILVRVARLVVVLLVIGILLYAGFWFLHVGPLPANSNPEQQNILPTVVSSPTAMVNTNAWSNEMWMTANDAQSLQKKENVINLAYLQAGGAQYSQNHSITFKPEMPWQQMKPLGITTLSVTNTAIQFSANGYTYVLNVYQPFVLAENPDTVIIVDGKGAIWQAQVFALKIVSVEEVLQTLPITVNPNSGLTFTY
jgi:hypothetical protein